MTPIEFLDKWRQVELKERAAAQEHFLDLCRLLELPTPAEADPEREGSDSADEQLLPYRHDSCWFRIAKALLIVGMRGIPSDAYALR